MKTSIILIALSVCAVIGLGLALAGCGGDETATTPTPDGPTVADLTPADYAFSGPYRHENLTVFFVHGPNQIEGEKFLTLAEAMEAKTLLIHETGNVSELSVENVGTIPVFIQSGEIIRGGKQDRVLRYDLIVAARSGKKPLKSFCVESGRWSARGGESVAYFSSSSNAAPSAKMRTVVLKDGDQGKVWGNVADTQTDLSLNVGGSVRSVDSASSMELTLEHERVKAAVQAYIDELAKAPHGKTDVIGLVVAVNGEVESVDVYGSGVLFEKLWPKLLKAAAVNAVAQYDEKKPVAEVAEADVKTFIKDAQEGKSSTEVISETTVMEAIENDGSFSYEANDAAGKSVHRGFLKK
ncbi:MAG: ARPP-1 family domain-containing protein [Planctomycetota bacterium]